MEDIIDIIVTETTNLIEITSQPTDEVIDVNIIDNREDITLNVTPSVVEININQLTGNFGILWGEIEGTLSNQTDLQNALNLKADLVDGKVPSSQLPSYVDDVVEVANYASLPATGEVGKIYITLDTNFIYRWTGSTYVEIKDSSAVWGAITGTLSNQTDLQSALNLKANDNAVVHLSGSETITGAKTLTGGLTLGTSSGDNQTLLNLPATNQLIYREGVGSLYGFNIESGIDNSLFLTNTEGGYFQTLYFGDSTGAYNVFGFSTSSNSGTTWNPRFVINQNGYIGLNKNNPTEILDVAGNGLFSGSLTANSIVKSGGTSSQFLKADGSVDSSSYALTSQLHNAVTIGTANGLSLSTQVLSLGLASSSANGALSSTDWTTFNSKQAALSGTGFVKISGTTISYDNTSYLPLTGGTLTGTLNGTNITITNSLIAKGGTFNGGASYGGIVTIDGLGSDLLMNRANTSNGSSITLLTNAVEKWNIGLRSSGATDNFFIYNSNLTANSLTINSSNSAATFASSVTASSFVKTSGTSSQFLKADGSVDSSTYLTTGTASSTYLPLSGGTLTGALTVTNANINLSNAYYLTARNNANTAYLALIGRNTSDKVVIDPDGYGLTVGGAATFSSSVSAGGNISTTGGSFYTIDNGRYGFGAGSTYIDGDSSNAYLRFFTSSSEKMRITSGGNVGIGTTAPTAKLQIEGANDTYWGQLTLRTTNTATQNVGGMIAFGGFHNGTSNASNWAAIKGAKENANANDNASYLNFQTQVSGGSLIERMRITSSGNVGIGTTAPANYTNYVTQTINGTNGAILQLQAGGTASLRLIGEGVDTYIDNVSTGAMMFRTGSSSSERMRITSGGYTWATNSTYSGSSANHQFNNSANGNTIINFYHQGTDPYGLFTYFTGSAPNNTTNYFAYFRDTSGPKCIIFSNGNIQNSNNSYGAISDIKLKENITDASSKLTDLLKVKIRNYNLIGDANKQIGVIAQELEEVFPSLIEEIEDRDNNGYLIGTKTKSVKYSVFVPMLIKAVQELSDKITTLEKK